MDDERESCGPGAIDVLVVGAGPAGSVAALVLARAGARVALLDKARFPRDKACGDFVGPRGLQVLADLGLPEPGRARRGRHGGGRPDRPAGGPAVLRRRDLSRARARAVPRMVLDESLRAAALDAGADPVEGRAGRPIAVGRRSGRLLPRRRARFGPTS